MWADYFPHAQIVGIDIHAKEVAGPRIAFELGDQSDPDFLRHLVTRYGPFDLVVDDGSHIGRHIIASYSPLWDAVKPMGFYIIEDLATAYDERWEGGPPGTPGTGVALLKELLDDTVRRYDPSHAPTILSMHVYDEVAVMQKAPTGLSLSR
jgi:demethylmacrocin O-methyltransferase